MDAVKELIDMIMSLSLSLSLNSRTVTITNGKSSTIINVLRAKLPGLQFNQLVDVAVSVLVAITAIYCKIGKS